jgi:translation initiation factor 5B
MSPSLPPSLPHFLHHRVKSEYVHHQSLTGAIGIKIVAPDISRAVAGTTVLVQHPEDDIEDIKDEVQSDLTQVFKALSTENRGVMVHASTLGALEALLQFLRDECKPSIPVCHINIGPIHKRDIMRANIMNERGSPEFATILAFDVKIDSEAAQLAEELHVRIFTADIIYHLFDQFTHYMNGITEARRKEAELVAVYPCVIKILPQHIFNKKDPFIFGVEVVEGQLKVGTPLCIPLNNYLEIGRVIGIENNRKEVTFARRGTTVSVKISNESNPTMTFGRQFDHQYPLYSKISRESIDALKEFFKRCASNFPLTARSPTLCHLSPSLTLTDLRSSPSLSLSPQ